MLSTIRIARYAPDAVLPRHGHAIARLCVVLSGVFEEDANRFTAINRPGQLLYRPADWPHAERFDGKGAVCALISPSCSWLDAARDHGIDLSKPASIAVPQAARLGATLLRETVGPDEFSALSCEAVAWECLALLGRACAPDHGAISVATRRAVEFLQENLGSPIGLAQLARVAGVHPTTLSRQFRSAFGQSVGGYVRCLRLEHAARLLREGRIPIAEIALECGFSNQAHLTTLLKQAFGVTPGRLRTMHRP